MASAPMPQPIWCVMPILVNWPLTCAAISDLLAQSVPTRLLLINQGAEDAIRFELEKLAEAEPERIFVWSHDPLLPSLAATWNQALDFVWVCGGTEALVVNNDVRLHPDTVTGLRSTLLREQALFVSAVGVHEEQFKSPYGIDTTQKGGPDFSCFLISHACHAAYRFDEGFTPAFAEDLDYHRRLLLAGDGTRIFSVNLPFHHVGGGSQTMKSLDGPAFRRIGKAITEGSRAHYARKWGGPVNAECYAQPFEEESARDGVTTPELQRRVQAGQPPIPCPMHDAQAIGSCGTCAALQAEQEAEDG